MSETPAVKTKAERFMEAFDRMRTRLIEKTDGLPPMTIAAIVMAELKDLTILRDAIE